MSKPVDITVDESIFAIPRANCSEDEIDTYANNLLKLQDYLVEGTINLYMIDGSYDSIAYKKCYSNERLLNFFNNPKRRGYSSKDIMSAVKYIKSCISSFEDNFDILGVSVDGKVKLTPMIRRIASTKKRKHELEQSILMIAVLRKCSDKDSRHVLALVCESIGEINVEAKIICINCKEPKIFKLPYTPDTFAGYVPVLGDLDIMDNLLGAIDLLDSESDDQVGKIIRNLMFR